MTIPEGVVALNPDGTITFTPNPGVTTPVNFTYTVADPQGNEDTAGVTVTPGTNDAPVARPDTNATTEDVSLNVTAANGVSQNTPVVGGRDSDVDGDTLSVSAVSFGATTGSVGSPLAGVYGTLVLNADGSYSYVPNAAAQALDSTDAPVTDVFTYTVKDPAGLTATTTLTITVTGTNDAPIANPDNGLTPENTPVVLNLLANDTDPDGEPLTITEIDGQPISVGNPVTLPEGVVSLNPDGTVTFTPNLGFNGPVDFPYTVTDGTTPTEGQVRVVVDSINDTPVATDDTVTTVEDTPVSFDPRGNDKDVDGDPLTVTQINGQPITPTTPVTVPEGVVSLNPDGTLTFTPNADFNGTVADIPYTISDGRGGVDDAVIRIPVTPVNDAPVALPEVDSTPQDTPTTGNVLTNETDVDNTPAQLSVESFTVAGNPAVITVPAGATGGSATIPGVGVLVINANGDYTFTPAPGFNGDVPVVT